MSFQALFAQMDQELKNAMDEYSKMAEQITPKLQKIIEQKEKKLEEFIQDFQGQILNLKTGQQRDSEFIENMRHQIEQRKLQNQLVQNAIKMQEILCEKLRESIQNVQEVIQEIDEKIEKHQENLNRNQIDLDNIENQSMNKEEGNQIQFEKQLYKFTIKIDKNGVRNYQINYNATQDKFWVNSTDKNVINVVGQFNFHRNLKRLHTDLYRVS